MHHAFKIMGELRELFADLRDGLVRLAAVVLGEGNGIHRFFVRRFVAAVKQAGDWTGDPFANMRRPHIRQDHRHEHNQERPERPQQMGKPDAAKHERDGEQHLHSHFQRVEAALDHVENPAADQSDGDQQAGYAENEVKSSMHRSVEKSSGLSASSSKYYLAHRGNSGVAVGRA
jgi:hypothetical protein